MKKAITLDVAKAIPALMIANITPHTNESFLVETVKTQLNDYFCSKAVFDKSPGVVILEPIVSVLLDITDDEFVDILP